MRLSVNGETGELGGLGEGNYLNRGFPAHNGFRWAASRVVWLYI